MKTVSQSAMPSLNSTPAKQSGFSLIELMIASVIGLVLLGGIVTIFTSNSASSKMSSGLTRIQDSGRVAIDILSYNIRMAGYEGCRDEAKENIDVVASVAPTINFPDEALWGAEINGTGGWTTPTPHPDLTNLPSLINLKENTDVLYVQHGSGRSVNLQNDMVSSADDIVLPRNPDQITAGDLVMIADCGISNVFRATDVSVSNSGVTTIQHGTGKNIQASLSEAFSGTGGIDTVSVRVMRFESKAYFVGDSGRTTPDNRTIWSLFELDTSTEDAPADRQPIELIEGVESFKILYGVRPDDETDSDIRYVTADNVIDSAQIVSVQLGLLIGTADNSAQSNDSQSYNIAGWTIGPPGENTDDNHDGDRRIRAAFNATVQIRNRSIDRI